MSIVYSINKGVNRPIVFRGLKYQYIWWLGIGLAVLLLAFTVLYIVGMPVLFCMALVFVSGFFLFRVVYRYSRDYGEHGLMKKIAKRGVPQFVKCDRLF
jgi:Flp pilus assembly protein TadB